ncbi:sigma D regulator [Shewanella sp. 10N.286.48.A6]|uniref:sigma D regulator n=1 Tax=Shewanella sp. 10N.286.48.A6 TaxID=1880833 RepID=UPI000C823FCD|nr:sigma D regulator [Shewanella sp. 10N.286.48.A6]PMI00727.1 anti-RNA polymerase sigma 70 factor [Shewanella sp. 10N.286.48.A6]
MLTKLEKAEQKWGGSNKLVDQWLQHRRALLIQYFKIAGLAPYSVPAKSLPELDTVKQFCAQLVDYVSEGHFEVYDQLVNECEKSGEQSKARAQLLLPQISESTDAALDFNDKYTEADSDSMLLELDSDLSNLAQEMEARFALEDELLEQLHQHHSKVS